MGRFCIKWTSHRNKKGIYVYAHVCKYMLRYLDIFMNIDLHIQIQNAQVYYQHIFERNISTDMQKFPLRMKDNDLLVTELYRDPANDMVTALSVYLTPRTSKYKSIQLSFFFVFHFVCV